MPSKQDILTAIKNANHFLKIPELQGAKVRLNKNGSPFVYAGGFNMVFQLTKNSKKWAFRVWHVPMGDTKSRYQTISKYLTNLSLPYFADFIFEEKGILVNGELLDTIRMEWLDGLLLKEYLEKYLNNKSVLDKLADDFLKMCQDLRTNHISHGDLQEGNILVSLNGDIKLVDYDSVCIPSIEGQEELVTGLKGYQHPSRFKNSKASLKADYFSELIIYLSIQVIAQKPELWSKYEVKNTQYLLFTEKDFDDFEQSNIYQDIKGLSPKTDELILILSEYLETKYYTGLKPFQSYLLPPVIKVFKLDNELMLQGGEALLEWEVENAIEIEINNGIGKVKSSGKIALKPKCHSEFTIKVMGFSETIEKSLAIKVFPTPIIKSIQVPMPLYEKSINLNISMPQFSEVNLEINMVNNNLQINMEPQITNPIFNRNLPKSINLGNGFTTQTNNSWSLRPFFYKFLKHNK